MVSGATSAFISNPGGEPLAPPRSWPTCKHSCRREGYNDVLTLLFRRLGMLRTRFLLLAVMRTLAAIPALAQYNARVDAQKKDAARAVDEMARLA